MSIVSEHVMELVQLTRISENTYRPLPKKDLSERQQQLFWKYHGHFPNDFARGLNDMLDNERLIEYDHLTNTLHTETVA